MHAGRVLEPRVVPHVDPLTVNGVNLNDNVDQLLRILSHQGSSSLAFKQQHHHHHHHHEVYCRQKSIVTIQKNMKQLQQNIQKNAYTCTHTHTRIKF